MANKKTRCVHAAPEFFCSKLKEFLSQNKIEYMERKIAADETALAELEKLGYRTTPATLAEGEVVTRVPLALTVRAVRASRVSIMQRVDF